MSMFEDNRYRWRETYFVLFDAKRRPTLASVGKALSALNKRFQLTNLNADEQGRTDSLTLISPDDYAALSEALAAQMQSEAGWRLVADPEVLSGGCRVESEQASVVASLDARAAGLAHALLTSS